MYLKGRWLLKLEHQILFKELSDPSFSNKFFFILMATIHLDKNGIYDQRRKKHFPWYRDRVTDFIHPRPLSVQSSKDYLLTKFYCISTKENWLYNDGIYIFCTLVSKM